MAKPPKAGVAPTARAVSASSRSMSPSRRWKNDPLRMGFGIVSTPITMGLPIFAP